MPIPFLLAGLAVATGVIGAGGHLCAKDTNEEARRISHNAEELYNNAKSSLEMAQNETEEVLLKLGYAKKNTLDNSMEQFLFLYDKIKKVCVKETVGLDEVSKFTFDQQGAIQLRKMIDIYSSSIKSGATGAAVGAVVALAASGWLPVVGGELAMAGSLLVMGEISAAAGIAGSALSFGAAMTPLSVVAGPVILFTGISASSKADENLEKANAMYTEAEVAVEKMEVSKTLCKAITGRAKMFNELLNELDGMFSEYVALLSDVIKEKESRFLKKEFSSTDFSDDEFKLIMVTRSLAGAVKAVIDTPILSKEGTITCESKDILDKIQGELPNFSRMVDNVKTNLLN